MDLGILELPWVFVFSFSKMSGNFLGLIALFAFLEKRLPKITWNLSGSPHKTETFMKRPASETYNEGFKRMKQAASVKMAQRTVIFERWFELRNRLEATGCVERLQMFKQDYDVDQDSRYGE